MVAASSITTLLLALAIAITAKPVLEQKSHVPVKIPLKRSNVVKNDRHRTKYLRGRVGNQNGSDLSMHSESIPSAQTNDQGYIFSVTIGVGNPITNYDLFVDTGSSNTWIGANTSNPYVITNTSQPTGDRVSVNYSIVDFTGIEYIDEVIVIGSNLVITNQWIGVASEVSNGFQTTFPVDGFMGIGPTALTRGTLSPDSNHTIPTITDSLFASGAIEDHLVALNLLPVNTDPVNISGPVGELNWGGTDPSLFIGDIIYTPITISNFWGFSASLTYGTTTALLNNAAGLVETGTFLFTLVTDAFNLYKAGTGGVLDPVTGLLTITSDQFKGLQGLTFIISGAQFTLTADAQVLPQSLNVLMGGVANKIYLIVQDIGHDSGAGVDFIFGTVVLQRFYCVLDTGNQRIGFAETWHTNASINFGSN